MRKLLLATVAVLVGSMGVSAVAEAQTAPPAPAPGTVTVRLNGRARFYAGYVNDRDLNRGPAEGGRAALGATANSIRPLANPARPSR